MSMMKKIETEPALDLSKPSIPGLVFLLRHPQIWPEGFKFDFGHYTTCAVGLAHRYWAEELDWPDSSRIGHSVLQERLGIGSWTAFVAFLWKVNPTAIADYLERKCA